MHVALFVLFNSFWCESFHVICSGTPKTTSRKHRAASIPFHFPYSMSLAAQSNSNSQEIRPVILNKQLSRPNGNTYWVTNNLIAGEYPTDNRGENESREKILRYLNLGVDFFVDLTREGEKESYESILMEEASKAKMKVEYCRLPVQDFGIPTREEMSVILDTIDSATSDNKKVYVHCRGGIGRTGTAVGCYLARHGYEGEAALREVNQLFQNSGRSCESSCSPETKAQIKMVQDWME